MENQTVVTGEQMNDEARLRLVNALQGKGAHLTFESAVKDFPEELMNTRPSHVPYSFWHQLEHIRRTQLDMMSYIDDLHYVAPEWPKDYWPDQEEDTTLAGWKDTVRRYLEEREKFVALIQRKDLNLLAPLKRLNERSVLRCVLIIVDHTAYHLGEFVMGRQMLGAWQSELTQ